METSFALAPLAVDDTRPFWEFAAHKQFRMQRCAQCRAVRWPPGPVCPDCWSFDYSWEEVGRRAVLESWVVYRRQYFEQFRPPYVVAQGALEAGPRFTASLIGARDTDIQVGIHLEIVLQPLHAELPGISEPRIPVWVLAAPKGDS